MAHTDPPETTISTLKSKRGGDRPHRPLEYPDAYAPAPGDNNSVSTIAAAATRRRIKFTDPVKARKAAKLCRTVLSFKGAPTPWSRRRDAIVRALVNDLGGRKAVTTAELLIVQRAAVLATELELMEIKIDRIKPATPSDITLYASASNTLRRLLTATGLERRARTVNVPTVESYLEHMSAQANGVEETDDVEDMEDTDDDGE